MVDILMPRLSDTMEEGVVNAWLKQVGDEVKAGDTLVEIETDKAVMEHQAYEDGVLEEIVVAEGDSAPIGAPIARLRAAGEPESAPAAEESEPAPAETGVAAAEAESAEAEPAAPAAAQAPATPATPAAPAAASTGDGARILSSPLARRDAREYGIDLATVTGTGPGGRIIRADVARARDEQARAASAPAAAPAAATPAPEVPVTDSDEVISLTPIRRTIARRLSQSKQTAPHYYVTKTVDAEPLMTLRADLNDRLVAAGRPKVSVNDIIVRAAAVVLRDHPVVNSSFADDSIVQHGRIHVGVAVATDAGLVVPVIRDADSKNLTTIAAETRELAGRARERKLTPDEMTGSTFTVSNLGMYGIDHFTAVINPPEAAILAVGAVRSEAGVRDGAVGVVQRMTMTMSSDHRVVDGAQAAEFIRDLATVLEDPWLAVA
ncbi:dihydrolipoamide acetyltransferase family protein [Haloactinopolyspora sp.]|uniref:dihydrolipoamide acetyltransferase family protein n=1 Tax=Haloactinopolyspora sp. TaxID=1966353 RepID=UPI002617171F|nr:dihydrolipoamide acetyltransferase family protein [Haloactinopolyspora sp.]